MLRLVPKHWVPWEFRLEDSAGVPRGEVALSSWRERGSVSVEGQQHRVARQGFVGSFVLEGSGGILARADKVGAFKREFSLTFGNGEEHVLKQLRWWRREFGLFRGETQVGSIAAASWFGRRAVVDLPEDLPRPAQAFVGWLVLVMWRRDAVSAAAAGGAVAALAGSA